MTVTKNQILAHDEIAHKIKRIAYQIYETFVDDNEIVLAGIAPGGIFLTSKIREVLEKISPLKVIVCEVKIDKENPLSSITTSIPEEMYSHKSVVVIDDVLNSGSTLIYTVKHFLNVPLKKFKTAVLVDRNHKRFPVKADFKGISLSTSLQEKVIVTFGKNNKDAVYLQ
ncbi:phosphoribosyltransferase family protein [Leptobacterium sp. I13]|uniref:phosphoribosyltransferase family protein n=1 Tax=Leptobacterium meishanense TaxID=3128904 RepID=UPI0030EE6900